MACKQLKNLITFNTYETEYTIDDIKCYITIDSINDTSIIHYHSDEKINHTIIELSVFINGILDFFKNKDIKTIIFDGIDSKDNKLISFTNRVLKKLSINFNDITIHDNKLLISGINKCY